MLVSQPECKSAIATSFERHYIFIAGHMSMSKGVPYFLNLLEILEAQNFVVI